LFADRKIADPWTPKRIIANCSNLHRTVCRDAKCKLANVVDVLTVGAGKNVFDHDLVTNKLSD
jgi:hypothetical protein